MQTRNLYQRLTHKYQDAYRELDQHVYLGTVRLTPPKQTTAPTDYDDGGKYVQYAQLPAGLSRADRKLAREVLAENLSKWGCKHEYDCCGCELRRATAYPTRDPRRIRVVVSVGYNY